MIHRVIARLDIKGPNLVKGIHLEGLRVLGKPEDFALAYYQEGADELIYVDVVASLYGRNSLDEIISRTAKRIFIPLTVAGGVRTIEDVKRILRAGADKVAVNTAAIKQPSFIQKAAQIFGSSTITVSIEAIKQSNGEYLAYTDNGREYTGVEVLSWAKSAEKLGAGEILLTSIDREGTGTGYDLELIKRVAKNVSIPVVASGGAGKLKNFSDAIKLAGVDAVCTASMLHYNFLDRHQRKFKDEAEGNVEFLKTGREFAQVQKVCIPEIKSYLQKQKIDCRIL